MSEKKNNKSKKQHVDPKEYYFAKPNKKSKRRVGKNQLKSLTNEDDIDYIDYYFDEFEQF